jgi:acetyl-CoA synthetase
MKTISFVVSADIGWIIITFYILYGLYWNRATTVISFEVINSSVSLILVVLGNYRVHTCVLYGANSDSVPLCKENVKYVQNTILKLKSNRFRGRTHNEEAWHWYNDHRTKKSGG